MVKENARRMDSPSNNKINRLNQLVETLCGVYTRVARRFGVDRSFVSRVTRDQRRSKLIEDALLAEYDRTETNDFLDFPAKC